MKANPDIIKVEDKTIEDTLSRLHYKHKVMSDLTSQDHIEWLLKDFYGQNVEDRTDYKEKYNLFKSIMGSNHEYMMSEEYKAKEQLWEKEKIPHREYFECGCIVDFNHDKTEGVAVRLCPTCE